MSAIVAFLVFIVSGLVADRINGNGLHGTTAGWTFFLGTVLALSILWY